MFAFIKSRSSLKLGHLGSKYEHQAKSKENLFNAPEVTFLMYLKILLKIFFLLISRSSLKLGHGVKTRSWARSKENLVNTL